LFFIRIGIKKYTIGEVVEIFAKEKYEVLSDIYINSKQKMRLKCSKGHIIEMTLSAFLKGSRCGICFDNRKYNVEKIKNVFKKDGYILLSTEYINNKQKLRYKCTEGHIGEITLTNFLKGKRCSECFSFKKYTLEKIKEIFRKEKYKLLSKEYDGAHFKLKYQCPNGHMGEIPLHEFMKGHGCSSCYFKGEAKLYELLNKNFPNFKIKKHKFIYKWTYKRKIKKRYCDFFIDENNIKIMIEHDGLQHIKPISFGCKDNKIVKENFKIDQLKHKKDKRFCDKNDIILYRIQVYHNKDDEKIYKKAIKELKEIVKNNVILIKKVAK